MSLVLVTVTGKVQGYDDQPSAGSITFTPHGWRTEPDDDLILAPEPVSTELLDDGTFTVALTAPDSGDEDEVRYRVDLALKVGRIPVTDSYDVVMPICDPGSYLNLARRDLSTGLMVVSVAPAPVPVDNGEGDGAEVWS